MNWLLVPLGFALVAAAMLDALRTTLSVGSVSGPVTGWVNHHAWHLALRLSDRTRFLLRSAGVGLTLTALITWLVLLWLGWSLVFAADPAAVLSTETDLPASFLDRVYFTGYTLFTLGNGEFRPHGFLWQALSVVALVNGLFLVTLGITYLIPLASAATERRSTAALIAALGNRPDEPLVEAWDGKGFDRLGSHLVSLAPEIALLAQRHLAYPVLHYFHSPRVHTAGSPMVARLDEMVTLLRFAIRSEHQPAHYETRPLHETLTQFLNTLQSAFISAAPSPPPPPPLDRLRAAGLPVVDDEQFATALRAVEDRRKLLLALVENDGWRWEDVWPDSQFGEHEPTGEGEQPAQVG